jgi:hypothetical protein
MDERADEVVNPGTMLGHAEMFHCASRGRKIIWVINCPIPVQLIDQLLMAVVMINCPPYRGAIDRLPSEPEILMDVQIRSGVNSPRPAP